MDYFRSRAFGNLALGAAGEVGGVDGSRPVCPEAEAELCVPSLLGTGQVSRSEDESNYLNIDSFIVLFWIQTISLYYSKCRLFYFMYCCRILSFTEYFQISFFKCH